MYNVDVKATKAANMGGYVIGLQPDQAWTTQDSCGYIFGSKGKNELVMLLAYDDSTEDSTNVLVHYMEW